MATSDAEVTRARHDSPVTHARAKEHDRAVTTVAGRADRGLEHALLFNFLIHAVAMLGMATLLLPMMPGGGGADDDATRIAAIAQHPWRFRAGWLPWQLCAVADLWMAVAMVRVGWIPACRPCWCWC
jgi:hypothetical protein